MPVNDIAYIEKTLPGVLDTVYAKESLIGWLKNKGMSQVQFIDAKTIKVFKMTSTGYKTYNRGGYGNTNASGAVATTTEQFVLGQERFARIPVDKLDSIDDGDTVIGHLAVEFARVHDVPEQDAYVFSKLASYTSATYGNRVSESISANSIITKFNAAFKWMSNHKVPQKDQAIYVSTSVMELIRNTSELTKRLTSVEVNIKDFHTTLEAYEGRPIFEVPEDEFYTELVMGDGYYPASGSKIINFMVIDATAPIIADKYSFTKLYSSDNHKLDFVGYELQMLKYYDCFVPENKKPGIYCSVSTTSADTIASALLVDAIASTESGKTIIKDVLTNPAGIMYDKLYLATASSKPTIGSSTSALTQIYVGTAFTPNASHNYIVASLGGYAVAVSADFTNTLPVGA